MSNELIKNTVTDFKDVLVDLSSEKAQMDYKKSVPYVHIPIELMEEFSDHVRMLEDIDWYSALYTRDEVELIRKCYMDISTLFSTYENGIPDVPDVFETDQWSKVMKSVEVLYTRLNSKIEIIIKNAST